MGADKRARKIEIADLKTAHGLTIAVEVSGGWISVMFDNGQHGEFTLAEPEAEELEQALRLARVRLRALRTVD